MLIRQTNFDTLGVRRKHRASRDGRARTLALRRFNLAEWHCNEYKYRQFADNATGLQIGTLSGWTQEKKINMKKNAVVFSLVVLLSAGVIFYEPRVGATRRRY